MGDYLARTRNLKRLHLLQERAGNSPLRYAIPIGKVGPPVFKPERRALSNKAIEAFAIEAERQDKSVVHNTVKIGGTAGTLFKAKGGIRARKKK